MEHDLRVRAEKSKKVKIWSTLIRILADRDSTLAIGKTPEIGIYELGRHGNSSFGTRIGGNGIKQQKTVSLLSIDVCFPVIFKQAYRKEAQGRERKFRGSSWRRNCLPARYYNS